MKPMTKAALTKLLNLSRTALDNHLRRPDTPKPVDGRSLYDPEDVAQYVMHRRMEDNRGGAPALVEHRIHRCRLQNEQLALQLAKMRGDLVPWNRVEQAVNETLSSLRSRILNLPNSISTQCAGRTAPEIHQIVDAALREALEGAALKKPEGD